MLSIWKVVIERSSACGFAAISNAQRSWYWERRYQPTHSEEHSDDVDRLEAISITVHEAVRAWAMAHGQADIPSWDEAPDWMHASTRESVEHAISNPGSGGQGQHDQWLQQKQRDGWQYGALKDAEAKTHPLLVPYDELPEFEKSKDALVQSIVAALAGQ